MSSGNDELEEAVVQERQVAAEPEVALAEEAEEATDELEEETEEESEEKESERIEDRLVETKGVGRAIKKRRTGSKKKAKAMKTSSATRKAKSKR